MKRTKVTTVSLILLLSALVGMLLLPSQVAMAQDPAIEVARRTLQGVSDDLRWDARPKSFAFGRGFFIQIVNVVEEIVELPGVAAVSGVVSIWVFASHEEALQETRIWDDVYESIQPTTFHTYQAFRYTRESPPMSRLSWFCGRIWLDTYVLRPGEFPQNLEQIAKVLHQAALANGLYDYCEAVATTPETTPAPKTTPASKTITAYGGQTEGTSWPREAKLVERPFKVPSGGATIVKVECTGRGFVIRKVGQGFPYESFDKASQAIGFRLPQGEYVIYPNLGPHQNEAEVRLELSAE